MKATLLFAHGARDPQWARPFEAIAQQLAQRPGQTAVALAYLEFLSPSLPEAVDQLVAQGCDHIVMVPLFLGAGGHVRRDVPVLLDAARARHPGLRLEATCTLGESPEAVAALADATAALVERSGAVTP